MNASRCGSHFLSGSALSQHDSLTERRAAEEARACTAPTGRALAAERQQLEVKGGGGLCGHVLGAVSTAC